VTTAAGNGGRALLDQDARSTFTTLIRGSRLTWMFKTKPSGQVGRARRSATVFAVIATRPVSSTQTPSLTSGN
jgi:hypothetical protein